jgi:hypothetical protein
VSRRLGPIPILDQISAPAAAAYSLRKLRAAYTGSAVRVRRSSDNAEANIGFTASGDLDTAALRSFVEYENLLLRSEEVNQSPWVLDNGGASNPVITANFASAPDGTMTADRVQLNKTGGTFSRVRQDSVQPSNTYTYSVYLKNNSAGVANVGIRIAGVGVNCVVTQDWQRFGVTIAATTVPDCQVLLFNAIGSNETADILVWGNQLNTGATPKPYQQTVATAFTANGFVTTWYDQSGNARNATQTTALSQPQIVSNGVIETQNGRPVLNPDGVDDTMVVASSGVTTYPISINTVVFRQDATENGAWVKVGGSNPNGVGIGIGASSFDFAGTSLIGLKENVVWVPTSTTVASLAIVTMLQPSGTTATEIYQNGAIAAITSGATDAPVAPSPNISLFGYGTTRFASDPMGEVLVFPSVLSSTDRQILERNQGAYYNVTVA